MAATAATRIITPARLATVAVLLATGLSWMIPAVSPISPWATSDDVPAPTDPVSVEVAETTPDAATQPVPATAVDVILERRADGTVVLAPAADEPLPPAVMTATS